MEDSPVAVMTHLRLSAFRSHRGRVLPLRPLTLLTGASGSGKSSAIEAYEALVRLGEGETLEDVFGRARGGPAGCVPHGARPDTAGRRGFRLGCTVTGAAGAVRLDLAVQAEPELRIAGERLTAADGRTLLSTALRDPGRRQVQAQWHTAGSEGVTRAPLPDDRLGTALLPLRVAGVTEGQRRVVVAAEQVIVALRSTFPCDPLPAIMRGPVNPADGLLRKGCDNLAAVLRRTRAERWRRHAALVDAVRAGCAGPVDGLETSGSRDEGVRAVLNRGTAHGRTPVEWLGDGELRYLALALVLLSGPGVLSMRPVHEVLAARQALTVLVDGFDRGMDDRQVAELVALAGRVCARRDVRLLAALGSRKGGLAGAPEGSLVDLGA